MMPNPSHSASTSLFPPTPSSTTTPQNLSLGHFLFFQIRVSQTADAGPEPFTLTSSCSYICSANTYFWDPLLSTNTEYLNEAVHHQLKYTY